MTEATINVNKTNFARHCLLKYIVSPFVDPPACQWHQSLWQVPQLAALIGAYGYNVDVIDWNTSAVRLDKKYDLLIDISPHNREIYLEHLKPGCPQILYATGSCPAWQRCREEERLADLYRRRGVRLTPATSTAHYYPHPDSFTAMFLIGSQSTLATFGPVASPVSFIKNTGYVLPPPTDFSQKSARDFLFFASQPQVLKGLDLLLEAFVAMPDVNLYVCSLFQREPDFCRAYEAELFGCPNIKPVGFIDIHGDIFREICRHCGFVILPSCSEGISGSLLTAMSAGLIPVVSQACGLEEDEAITLETCSIDCIKDTVRYLSQASAQWLRNQSFRALAINQQRYSPRHYIISVRQALSAVLGEPDEKVIISGAQLVQKRSACMIANTRVGIPLTGGEYWYGGVSYVETLVRSLAILPKSERPQLYLVVTRSSLDNFNCYRPFISLFDGIIYLGQAIDGLEACFGLKPLHCQSWDELFSLIDFYYPVNSDVLPYRQAVSWIPDFQHRYLPEFFSDYECQSREKQFAKIAAQAGLVILNSRSAAADFKKYYPDSQAKTRVLSAYPYPSADWYQPDPQEIQRKYRLPERYVLCCNQFWVHKNHSTLFQAVAMLKKSGQDIHLVCTGPTNDYRTPGYFDGLQAEIDALAIRENTTILGLIPREDQLQLLRRSLFVVQPSLFEGLSLVVQECRALAKPIVLSDLDVHAEYNYGTLFERMSPADLAQKLAGMLAASQPGPDRAAEADAKAAALKAAENGARQFSAIVLEHLGCRQPAEDTPAPVTILTALALDNIANQQAAIRSWRRCGFKVAAVNAVDDIDILQPQFPEVEFIAAARDGRKEYGKPLIYLDDLLYWCSRQLSPVCGIVKADTIFTLDTLAAIMAKEASGAMVFGARMDAAADGGEEVPHIGGFDYIFFDKDIIRIYPPEAFCLGLYWWDYWLTIMAIASDIPAKRVISPVARHIIHSSTADVALWRRLGMLLANYASTDFAVTADTMAAYQQLLFTTIKDNSEPLTLPAAAAD